jgi:DNA-binding response OmpR family regulator
MWKALLIDDEENIRKLLKAVLEMGDFTVETASSGASGIELLRRQSFDVVITDLRMETHLAGYEVSRFASHLEPRPLIAIVTAFPVPSAEWHRAGADVLLTKGAETLQLTSRLRNLLEARKPGSANGTEHSTPGSIFRRGLS